MFETLILGAGPAGTGPLVWAARTGILADWLNRGIAVIDRNRAMGGTIGSYALNADTLGGTFLECLEGGTAASPIAPLRGDPLVRDLAGYREALPPLPLVGQFLDRLGAALTGELARHRRSRFVGGVRALRLHCCADGTLAADLADAQGRGLSVRAASAVLALGGREAVPWKEVELLPGLCLDAWRHKLLPSGRLLAGDRAACQRAAALLGHGAGPPRAVILGGSHSAFSAAWMLLERMPGLTFRTGGLHILHRTPPRVFYPSRAEAAADGYGFTEDDVCQDTGRVHRLGGLRGDGRQVWRAMQGCGDAPRDDRVAARAIAGMPRAALQRLLDEADLIVPAFGYRLNTVPIFAADGTEIRLARCGPAVDAEARLLTAEGAPLANVFGVGLGSGFRPWGKMVGEASFHGQQNSLWLYQNGLGALIHANVRACAAVPARPLRSRPQPPPLVPAVPLAGAT